MSDGNSDIIYDKYIMYMLEVAGAIVACSYNMLLCFMC
jgi:hypothetical protein